MKILLISGHGAGDTGAVGCGYKEAELTREATKILAGKFEAYDCTVKRYPTAHDAYQDNKRGDMQTAFSSYGLVIEVHFNSYNGEAHGTECLYRPARMRALAGKVANAIARDGFFDRGAKQRTDLMNMNTCYRNGVPYILIETCFIDNKADMKRYKEKLYTVWDEVAEAVCKYYGVKKLASAGKPVETTKTSTSKKKPAKSKTKGSEALPVDGWWGRKTTKAAQKVFGTEEDGIVSNQPEANKANLPRCSTKSWEFKEEDYRGGSALIKAMQKKVGAKTDGYCGEKTVRALQEFLGVKVDGSCGPKTVEALQKWLNEKAVKK